MASVFYWFFLVIFVFGVIPTEAQEPKLIHVQVYIRHGDRTPVYLLPEDHSTWVEELSPGQLTAIGLEQTYALVSLPLII